MSVEQLEKNKVRITFSISPEKFEEGLEISYNENKNRLDVQGFRKGKASRKVIEMRYGKDIFYEDALNFCIPEVYHNTVTELDIHTVCEPDIKVLSVSADEGVQVQADVYVKPEVKVSDYKGITYHLGDIVVPGSDEESIEKEVNQQLDTALDKNSRIVSVTDRSVAQDDIVTIDFKGAINGEYFDGGEGSDYDLTIGSHSFIDTFEDQLVGKNIGETVTVNVTFPEDYSAENLAGKPAEFTVTIKEIKVKEKPALDDDFAADVSEFDTLEEYKTSIRDQIRKRISEQYFRIKESLIMQHLFDKAEVDIPEVMIETQARAMMGEFNRSLQKQGMSLEMLLQYSGQTFEDLKKSYMVRADALVRGGLVLEQVAKQEAFVVSDEEMDEKINSIAEEFKLDRNQFVESLSDEDKKSLTLEILNKKAFDFIMDNAIGIEGKSEEKEPTENPQD